MVPFRTCQILTACALLAVTPAFATRTHRAATSGHALHHKAKKHKFTPGQRQIEPERATEIQNALIREHYLSAPASGEWDETTETAMQKFQADHGWQTKLTPDSRALIKLGLGPHDDADASATASADPARATTANPAPSGTLASTTSIQN
jgi:hypothetical protein